MSALYRLCFVPFPLTPSSAFIYFVYRYLGLIDNSTIVKYHEKPDTVALNNGFFASDQLVFLGGKRDIASARKIFESSGLSGIQRYIIERMVNLLTNVALPERTIKKRDDLRQIAMFLASETENPQDILETVYPLFVSCINDPRDLFHDPFPTPPVKAQRCGSPLLIPPDCCHLPLPILKDFAPGEKEVVAWKDVVLYEGLAFLLNNRCIRIVVGGPSGGGKSTLAVSLTHGLNNLIKSLKSRPGFKGLNLKATYYSLDHATPTGDYVAKIVDGMGMGLNREFLSGLKIPWTKDLALDTFNGFLRAGQSGSILIGDLPGGKIDSITEITAALGDVGIIITDRWEETMNEWETFFNKMGITLMTQTRSKAKGEGTGSIGTLYHPGKMISGQIVGLNRLVRSWDPFVTALSHILLFDLLPSFYERRRIKSDKIISEYTN